MFSMKVYVDTSVFGGLFDEEFASTTDAFFQLIRLGRFDLLVSDVVAEEISLAPNQVQEAFQDMLPLDIRSPAEVIDYEEEETI